MICLLKYHIKVNIIQSCICCYLLFFFPLTSVEIDNYLFIYLYLLQLFVTVLEKTDDVVVKNNLVVLFGELLFRHPNVIEPWISYLYSR